jgi:tetrahydromethanopterin S-methyltransferase subunit D
MKCLGPPGLGFFADTSRADPSAPKRRFMGIAAQDFNVLLTAASMVGAINSMLAGAGVALAAHATANLSPGSAIALAVMVAVVLYLAHARLAIHQYNVGLADLRSPASVT